MIWNDYRGIQAAVHCDGRDGDEPCTRSVTVRTRRTMSKEEASALARARAQLDGWTMQLGTLGPVDLCRTHSR